MQNAVAFADNDVITIAWSYGKKPEGCMGFAIHRIDDKGKEETLPSHAVFRGDKIEKGQTTDDFPIQKFYWKDVYARLVAEKTGNRKFRYKVVPLEGKPHALKPMTLLPHVISNEVEIAPALSPDISAYFNRGLISTQRVSNALKGAPSKGALLEQIKDPKNALRQSLSGDMVEALTGFLARAKTSGSIYAALYELGDAQLIAGLKSLGKRLQIVLSNSVAKQNGKTVDANQPARDLLAKSAKKMVNRIMPSGHIGHNKFLVYANAAGTPKAVLLGSTNWTPTGLCAQTNNTLVIDDDRLAQRYLDYWNRLAADTGAAKGEAKKLQGSTLRGWDAQGKDLKVDGAALESWFSPNTPKARSKSPNEKRPPDMDVVADRIAKAKHAILFLAFYPGTPSIANWAGQAARSNKNLFVRGCVTNKSASQAFYYELKGTTPPKKVKGQKAPPVLQDPRVIGAEALDMKKIPAGWRPELLSAGFAIIHDKILVIDPFADDCVVVTGSHNLGHKASFDNDENLVIVEGNKKLAVAYATHVLDVYDHFSWRYAVKMKSAKNTDYYLEKDPDVWLNRYFGADGKIKNAQLNFWMQAAASPPARAATRGGGAYIYEANGGMISGCP